jgi:fatty acid desaturase
VLLNGKMHDVPDSHPGGLDLLDTFRHAEVGIMFARTHPTAVVNRVTGLSRKETTTDADEFAYAAWIVFRVASAAALLWLSLHTGYATLSGLCMALLWQQGTFAMHACSHRPFGVLSGLLTYCTGMTPSLWREYHDLQHARVDHSFSAPHALNFTRFSPANWFCRTYATALYANRVAFVMLLGLARFRVFADSVDSAMRLPWKEMLFELGMLGSFLSLHTRVLYATSCPLWTAFVAVAASGVLHAQLAMFYVPKRRRAGAAPEGEDWEERQLDTSVNITTPRGLDWFFGGWNRQVEHRLFPMHPTDRLHEIEGAARLAAKIRKAPHRACTFGEALYSLMMRMGRVGAE